MHRRSYPIPPSKTKTIVVNYGYPTVNAFAYQANPNDNSKPKEIKDLLKAKNSENE